MSYASRMEWIHAFDEQMVYGDDGPLPDCSGEWDAQVWEADQSDLGKGS
jgi:hypothetical protein